MIQHFLKEHRMRMDPSDTKSPILFSSDGRAELTRAPVCDECLYLYSRTWLRAHKICQESPCTYSKPKFCALKINVLMLGIYLHLYTYPPKVFANYNHYMEFIYEKDSLILNHDIK
ncbi:hypothetical protein T03_7056 [Trichinella britovi]|uniref:Uncharacterized protein n=1 Tax=Trichinella britovi TaxID=45882 RepID=A0A0V1D455_TRIBR|nr:hypothetical protein T03_7056 [Trichinella britovi]